MTEWTTFRVNLDGKRGRCGARWRIVQNESMFTESQLDQLIALSIVKRGLFIPVSHRIELVFEKRKSDYLAHQHGCSARAFRNGKWGKKRRWSCIIVHEANKKFGDMKYMAVRFMSILTHEMEHARQWCRQEHNTRPYKHGCRSERRANNASEDMLVGLAADASALEELDRIVNETKKEKQ